MFKLVEWSENIDLASFYKSAKERGFENNSSKEKMIDCFKNEKVFCGWVLMDNNIPIGFSAAHSFDIMGENSFRICARTCTLGEAWPVKGLKTVKSLITTHQSFTAQFFMPQSILWAGKNSNLYITSNESKVASQRIVHKTYLPSLEKINTVTKVADIFYRGTMQTVWKFNIETFIEQYRKNRTIGIEI